MQFSVQEKRVIQFIICSSTCNVANTSVHVSAVFATKSIQLYNYISFLRIYHTTRSEKNNHRKYGMSTLDLARSCY